MQPPFALPPPGPLTDLGPFSTEPDVLWCCGGGCNSTSFVFENLIHGSGDSGTAFQLIGPPGWYLLRTWCRTDGTASTVTFVQIMQTTSEAVVLDACNAPWGIAYLNPVQGYSVFIFPDTAACVRNSLTVRGAGCASLANVTGIVPPPSSSASIGAACVDAGTALLVAYAPDALVLGIIGPITVPTGHPATIIRIVGNAAGLTDAELLALSPDEGLTLSFEATSLTLVYLTITMDDPDTFTATGVLMTDTGIAVSADLMPTVTGAWPLGDEDECHNLLVYTVCMQYTAADVTGPDISRIAQVVWDDGSAENADVNTTDPPTLILPSDACSCAGFSLVAEPPIEVSTEDELVADFTTYTPFYSCALARATEFSLPTVVLVSPVEPNPDFPYVYYCHQPPPTV